MIHSCVIQGLSAQYGQQLVASVRTKGQRLTNGTPAPEPLSESALELSVQAEGALLQVQPQGSPAH